MSATEDVLADDTIAAIATPPGRGAVAIVRASGPLAARIGATVFKSVRPLRPRVATVGRVVALDGSEIDRGLALYFPAPHSATGEDVLELHVHGSTVVARDTLLAMLAAGARGAEPGEFTRRAFLNGKLDLSAAEAVGELIDAERRSVARAALGRLAGGLARGVEVERARLNEVVEELAASLDFPDEVRTPERETLGARLHEVDAALEELAQTWEHGRVLRDGLAVAIVGPPNAGKSSLLNALLGSDRAIVSHLAGTTRDTIEEQLALDGGIVARIVDTAGLRNAGDQVERAGVARSEAALEAAALALVVVDGSVSLDDGARAVLARTRERERVVYFSKRDLGSAGYEGREPAEADALFGSVHDAGTIDAVRAALTHAAGVDRFDHSRPHLGTARQADAVLRARRSLASARATLTQGDPVDLIVTDLVEAQAALGELTGADASEALLDAIFARFCIGK